MTFNQQLVSRKETELSNLTSKLKHNYQTHDKKVNTKQIAQENMHTMQKIGVKKLKKQF